MAKFVVSYVIFSVEGRQMLQKMVIVTIESLEQLDFGVSVSRDELI